MLTAAFPDTSVSSSRPDCDHLGACTVSLDTAGTMPGTDKKLCKCAECFLESLQEL